MALHRTIRESALFTESLAALGDMQRADDAMSGVVWALSRKPEAYDPVFQDVRLLKTDPLGDMPALSVRFKIVDANTVETTPCRVNGPSLALGLVRFFSPAQARS